MKDPIPPLHQIRLEAGGLKRMIFKIPSDPSNSMIL